MTKAKPDPAPAEHGAFKSGAQIDAAIAKIERRIWDLKQLDVLAAVLQDTAVDDSTRSDVRETIREVFGEHSPEFMSYGHIGLWAGTMSTGMSQREVVEGAELRRRQVIGILNSLIARLNEKKKELGSPGAAPDPSMYVDRLNLGAGQDHPPV